MGSFFKECGRRQESLPHPFSNPVMLREYTHKGFIDSLITNSPTITSSPLPPLDQSYYIELFVVLIDKIMTKSRNTKLNPEIKIKAIATILASVLHARDPFWTWPWSWIVSIVFQGRTHSPYILDYMPMPGAPSSSTFFRRAREYVGLVLEQVQNLFIFFPLRSY